MRMRSFVNVLLVFGLLLGAFPGFMSGQRAPTIDQRSPDVGKTELKSGTMPPFLIWTDLSQSDVESILPRGASLKTNRTDTRGQPATSRNEQGHPIGRNNFEISGLTNIHQFAVDLGLKSLEKNAGVPGFGKKGAKVPRQITPELQALIKQVGELIHDILFARPVPRPPRPFPPGPLPDYLQIQNLLPDGFDRRKDPPPTGGGYWEYYCEPTAPCVRPEEPNPDDVDDCKDEQDEVDRLLEKLKFWEDAADAARKQLAFLEGMKLGDDAVDGAVTVMIVYAVLTCPLGPAAGMVAVAPVAAGALIKKLIDYNSLDAAIDFQKSQLADIERTANSYRNGLNDAYADLRACRKRAAETAQNNTAAFQKFINVDLPAYYACLEKRKCRRRWVPK